MDVEEAHKVLGLYVGATHEQIEARFAELSQRLSTDEKTELKQLESARRIAMGEKAPAPAVPLWRRGPVVVLMIFVALALVSGAFWITAKNLDNTQAERTTRGTGEQADAARAAWESYSKATGVSSEQASRAEELWSQATADFDAGDYADAKQGYEDAMTAWFAAFAAEDTRITSAWETQVLGFWNEKLKGRFPFDREADEEAEADDVARLFNPASGAIWAVAQEHQALSEVEVQDRKVATPLKDLDALKTRAADISAALFGMNSPTIDVRFELRLKSPPMLNVYRLQVGGAEAVSRGEEFVTAHWQQSDGGAVLIRGTERGESKETLVDQSASDWGLLRMLSRGEYMGERDGVHAWEFEPEQIDARRGRGAAIHIKPGKQNPFDFKIFEAFAR